MKRGIVALIALLLAGLKPVSAAACEPMAPPPFTRSPGISYFIATTTKSGLTVNAVRAQVITGRTDSLAMRAGAAIFVPWSHGADCKPLPWNVSRDGAAWSPPEGAAFYTGVLRPRDRWIDAVPTVDIHMARLQPAWQGGSASERQDFSVATGPLLTPQEFFEFYPFLPTYTEFLEKQPAALRRLEAWASAHSAIAAREPARSRLGAVRRMFADTARQASSMSPPQEQRRWYPLSDIGTPQMQKPRGVTVQVSPELTYDLPKVQFSFRLNLQNRSSDTVYIANPLTLLSLTFVTAELKAIELPTRSPGLSNPAGLALSCISCLKQPPAPWNENASSIVFRMAVENKEVTTWSSHYTIMPDASLELVFECEKVVGERVMAAVASSGEKAVYVRLIMALSVPSDLVGSRMVESARIRLSVPKP